jgi:hypothetical protein
VTSSVLGFGWGEIDMVWPHYSTKPTQYFEVWLSDNNFATFGYKNWIHLNPPWPTVRSCALLLSRCSTSWSPGEGCSLASVAKSMGNLALCENLEWLSCEVFFEIHLLKEHLAVSYLPLARQMPSNKNLPQRWRALAMARPEWCGRWSFF